MVPSVGDLAPTFDAARDDGAPFALSDWHGSWVVLFFFPRSATTHCQMQARRFQALLPEFEKLGALVVGVSSDTAERQGTFRSVCRLDFPLVPDSELAVCRVYGVLEDAPVEEEPTPRARRETFLIAPDGRVARRWAPADPNSNAADVLAELRAMTA
ncbi:peroxiredoxin [Deinococcus pimensis]|uniref:peroxiredoxin n=1 Tax=Deinococcus pimensis TaxID=309888 RepID=UPI0004844D23|nr:peroxiredoxin [Deinococcus pimensis]